MNHTMNATLTLKDGIKLEAESFGSENPMAGEVVFATGMAGYPESLTDPSYKGQILTLTYPLIGNYGVPEKKYWESGHIQASGLIVSTYNETPSHYLSKRSLSQWLKDEGIPALQIKDTRFLTQHLRDHGSQLGKIEFERSIDYYDPNTDNLVSQVATKDVTFYKSFIPNPKNHTVVYLDCGGKKNIVLCLLRRGVNVITVPWDFDPFTNENQKRLETVILNSFQDLNEMPKQVRHDKLFDGIVVSNGPGDPKFADKTIQITKKALDTKLPLLGICLGHQLITLAAGGDTTKLKYGHRAQNQPCLEVGTKRCIITTQNHGFAVSEIPPGFKAWFLNANDGTNEGIIHTKYPYMSTQFHPEATPGPQDAEYVFDYFVSKIK